MHGIVFALSKIHDSSILIRGKGFQLHMSKARQSKGPLIGRLRPKRMTSNVRALTGEVDRVLLQFVAENQDPIGQGSLYLKLRRQGLEISAPTIGRKLQQLEFDGLLRKVGVDGRIITKRGRETLKLSHAEAHLRGTGEELFEVLRRGDKKHIFDLLSARRILERETAALAAEHASAREVRQMEETLRGQLASVKAGGLGIEEDIGLHNQIARASQNSLLYSLVALLRNNERYNFLIASMRAVVGTRLVDDHLAIVDGIKSRDPHKAREAMDRHIRKIADDLNRYWQRWINHDRGAS